MHVVDISVRHLVEFILRSGDIDRTLGVVSDAEAMQEGSRLHKKLQKKAGAGYQAEVPMKISVALQDDLVINLEGRADGVITDYRMPDIMALSDDSEEINYEFFTIDEIKSTYTRLSKINEPIPVHLAQAKCYAYIYAQAHALKTIDVQMTYVSITTEQVKQFRESYEFEALKIWFEDLIEQYAVWVRWQIAWIKTRNESIQAITFPFEYRPGQKRLVGGVYQTLAQKKKLFALAPTGTGKTISTLYPAVKALGEGKGSRIFYLTAKTITRTVAEETGALLSDHGLCMKSITLTARDKICIFDEAQCRPDVCERAKGHFDRVNDAVFDMITHEQQMTREVVSAYAAKYQVCPFEMQLDASLFADLIIGDYNYVFDPYVYLKRFFGDSYFGAAKTDYIYLIDEAHNLVERAREMYSSELTLSTLKELQKTISPYNKKMKLKVDKCTNYLKSLMAECETYQEIETVGGLTMHMMRLMTDMEAFLKSSAPLTVRETVLGIYLDMKAFVNNYDNLDEHYIIYGERLGDEDFRLKLFCVDPSKNLGARLNRGGSAIFFSATLLPVHYYKACLSTTPKEDYDLYIDSPFDVRNRLLMVAGDVSSKYTRRNLAEYQKISDYIIDIVRGRNGNYMVFFPSYAFMDAVLEVFSERELSLAGSGIRVVRQENSMTEEARQAFLDAFQADAKTTMLGFCVLGGIFSEGIDLKADRLIGAIVVGTGLPQVSTERKLLQQYYDQHEGNGFEFAYVYPGMNKVLQAAGRVIRTEADKGVIALLDERFNQSTYRSLFPKDWEHYEKVNMQNTESKVNGFWEMAEE